MVIRFVKTEDSGALLKIYAQYIDTAITFEYVLPTVQEFSKRIEHIRRDYPYLVCEEDDHIIGYAYAHRQMERAAYQWNAELSVYLDNSHTSKGLGKRFYCILMDILKLQGIKTVYGGVSMPNEKSEKLHESLGFSRLGTYHKTGYKSGNWHDVTWFEKEIAPYSIEPAPIRPISEISDEKLESIIREHMQV